MKTEQMRVCVLVPKLSARAEWLKGLMEKEHVTVKLVVEPELERARLGEVQQQLCTPSMMAALHNAEDALNEADLVVAVGLSPLGLIGLGYAVGVGKPACLLAEEGEEVVVPTVLLGCVDILLEDVLQVVSWVSSERPPLLELSGSAEVRRQVMLTGYEQQNDGWEPLGLFSEPLGMYPMPDDEGEKVNVGAA